MAGLGAATELAKLGADVVVVEARDRVGGRVSTDHSWGVPVELGAAWLEGIGQNVMVPLVRQAGLSRVPLNTDDEIIRNIHTGAPDAVAARRDATLIRLATALQNSDPPLNMSVASWLAKHGWVSDGPDDWAENTEVTQEYGLDPALLGTHAITEGADEYGRDDFVKGGYDQVPQMLARKLDVRLSTPVSAVSSQGSQVSVTATSGKTASADLAVIAVPLALMQAKLPAVTPMPTLVWDAIRRLTTGSLQKVILRFDRPWWREDHGDDFQVLGLVGGRWTEWYDITKVTGVPSLVGFCGGSAAAHRPTSDANCVAEAMAELRGAYGASA